MAKEKEKKPKKDNSFEIKVIVVLLFILALSIAAFFIVPDIVNNRKKSAKSKASNDELVEDTFYETDNNIESFDHESDGFAFGESSDDDYNIRKNGSNYVGFRDLGNCYDDLESYGCKDTFLDFMTALYTGDSRNTYKYIADNSETGAFYYYGNEEKSNEMLSEIIEARLAEMNRIKNEYAETGVMVDMVKCQFYDDTPNAQGGLALMYRTLFITNDTKDGISIGEPHVVTFGKVKGKWKVIFLSLTR